MHSTAQLEFEGVVEGYVVNQLHRNFWRVSSYMEWEDVMQEAKLIFWDCQQRYPDVEARHMMALFKTAWFNQFVDLAKKATKQKHVVNESNLLREEDDEMPRHESVGELDSDGLLAVMIRQAPSEIQTILALFINAPVELLEMASAAFRQRGKDRREGNRMINRCLGFHPESDPLGAIDRYFSPDL